MNMPAWLGTWRANGRPWPLIQIRAGVTTTAGLRQARNVEPEVQPRLGPDSRPQAVSAAGAPNGARFLPSTPEPVRPAARQSRRLHQLDWSVWTATLADKPKSANRMRSPPSLLPSGAGSTKAEPRSTDGLVRHQDRQAEPFPGALRCRRGLHQSACDKALAEKWRSRAEP